MHRSPLNRIARQALARAQRGVSLIFALITMVALSLAAAALIRSVDANTLVLGNLGFKQDSLQAANYTSRVAIDWLTANIADTRLHGDWEDQAYYATTRDTTTNPLDVFGSGTASGRVLIDWGDDDCGGHTPCLATREIVDTARNVRARYVILRLCDDIGDPASPTTTMHCARPLINVTNASTERNSLDYGNPDRIGTTTISQYFRILVRARSGRETATLTETLVHF